MAAPSIKGGQKWDQQQFQTVSSGTIDFDLGQRLLGQSRDYPEIERGRKEARARCCCGLLLI